LFRQANCLQRAGGYLYRQWWATDSTESAAVVLVKLRLQLEPKIEQSVVAEVRLPFWASGVLPKFLQLNHLEDWHEGSLLFLIHQHSLISHDVMQTLTSHVQYPKVLHCFLQSSVKMESIRLSKTSVPTYQNTEVMLAPLHVDASTNRKRKYSSNPFATSGIERGGWSASRSGHLTPGTDPVSIVQETRCVTGQIWTGTENLTPNKIRCPDRKARS